MFSNHSSQMEEKTSNQFFISLHNNKDQSCENGDQQIKTEDDKSKIQTKEETQESSDGQTPYHPTIAPKDYRYQGLTTDHALCPNNPETTRPKTETQEESLLEYSDRNSKTKGSKEQKSDDLPCTKIFGLKKSEINRLILLYPVGSKFQRWVSIKECHSGLEDGCFLIDDPEGNQCPAVFVIRGRNEFFDFMGPGITNKDYKTKGLKRSEINKLILLSPVGVEFQGWLLKAEINSGLKDGNYLVEEEYHCTALYVSGECYIYFDSYGLKLHDIPGIEVINNNTQFQHPYYDTCGLHAVRFIILLDKLGSIRKVKESYPSYSSYFRWVSSFLSWLVDDELRDLKSNEEHVLKYFTESESMYKKINNKSGLNTF